MRRRHEASAAPNVGFCPSLRSRRCKIPVGISTGVSQRADAREALASVIIIPTSAWLDAFAPSGRYLALPAQVGRQERDRVGRLLRLKFDGAEPDRPVVAEGELDAEFL
jgi:hypothetical protein